MFIEAISLNDRQQVDAVQRGHPPELTGIRMELSIKQILGPFRHQDALEPAL